ncbi:NADase-type glycan-binding domain-containing protein [Amycolatopsis pigmentata]|uniref:Zinc-ribbon domain-containing protein n=1 Tax=Amycolatopsis pigmentata TaxID=450801 RepID=A0ABW5FUL8_9PSEU
MRSCPACGASVADTDDFCGNCGTYLGWGTTAGDTSVTAQDVHPQDTPAGTDQPAAVQPAKPARPRPAPDIPVEVVTEDGPPCPVCGTPNPPGRRFCRRCAAPLTETTVVVARKPWWRRIRVPRWFRIGGSGFLVRRLVILITLVALILAGILLFPLGKGLFEDLLDKTKTPAPIGPVRVVASAEVPGHPAAAATDGLSNRYWGAPRPGEWIEFTFDHPFRLLSLVVHAGPSSDREQFTQEARPAGLDVIVTAADGNSETRPVELADQPGPQTIDLGISDVVRIRVVLRSATGLSQGKHIAVGEIEFFQRS